MAREWTERHIRELIAKYSGGSGVLPWLWEQEFSGTQTNGTVASDIFMKFVADDNGKNKVFITSYMSSSNQRSVGRLYDDKGQVIPDKWILLTLPLGFYVPGGFYTSMSFKKIKDVYAVDKSALPVQSKRTPETMTAFWQAAKAGGKLTDVEAVFVNNITLPSRGAGTVSPRQYHTTVPMNSDNYKEELNITPNVTSISVGGGGFLIQSGGEWNKYINKHFVFDFDIEL